MANSKMLALALMMGMGGLVDQSPTFVRTKLKPHDGPQPKMIKPGSPYNRKQRRAAKKKRK